MLWMGVDGSWGKCNGIRDKDGDDAGADFVYRGSLYRSVLHLVYPFRC